LRTGVVVKGAPSPSAVGEDIGKCAYGKLNDWNGGRGFYYKDHDGHVIELMLMPHRHPEDRVYTVMSGVFYGTKMYEWFDRVGYTVDRPALRREFADVAFHDFESWAKAQDWNTSRQRDSSRKSPSRTSALSPFASSRI